MSYRGVCAVAGLVTLSVAYQLCATALASGNLEGFYFSLAHTVIVGVAVVWALRPISGVVKPIG
jgi:hypothetical protein